ncbi:MAG: DUF1343 domain-containing protein [Treponema sp.]|nr:DUF1343 domain-containing protein [Treponema sp.]
MKKIFTAFSFFAISLVTAISFSSCKSAGVERVILGDEQEQAYLPLLKDRRVALFSNHSGIVGDKIVLPDGSVHYGGNDLYGKDDEGSLIHFGLDSSGLKISYGQHILDALLSNGVNVAAIFCPEHGFRGTEDAGANIASSVDEKTGIPILSLYESDTTHAPSAENMAKFDTLVVDMQDVGLRYYTYYIALYYLMDACAANGKSVVIFDRPNPNGFYVDGSILKNEYVSGVGRLPIPTVHGMTWGELARMINGEGWLKSGKNACDLTVIPCKNYNHSTHYALVRAPSPNIKDMRSVYLYASTCFFENTIVSVGRGTEFPFEVYGSPYFKDSKGNDFSFTPASMPGATKPPFMGSPCYGVDLRSKPIQSIWQEGINLSYLENAWKSTQDASSDKSLQEKADWFWGRLPDGKYWIDLLSGSDALRKQIFEGKSSAEIKKEWQVETEAFKNQRKKYLLYNES